MNHYRHLWCRVLLCCTLLSLIPHWWPQPIHAQENSQPTLQITGVESSQFPLLQVTIGGTNWPAPLADLPVELTVDGNALPIVADESVQQGLQLAIAIDVNNLFKRGQSGQSGYIETVGTVRTLVESGNLLRNQDWLAAYLLQGDTPAQPVQPWTQEPNLIFNSIVGNRPAEITETPLSTATLTALFDQFAQAPSPTGLHKVILLFSTGMGLAAVDPVIVAAQAQGITIHIVALVGAAGSSGADDPLQQLATATGGHYIALENPEMAAPLVEQLRQAHTARQLQVRADTATPQTLAVTVTLPDGSKLTDQVDRTAFTAIAAAGAQITITNPSTADIQWDELVAAPDNSGERLLPLAATFTWPGAQTRQLVQVTYTLRGPGGLARQAIRTAAPFDQATLALPAPNADGAAEYTLEVMALDELGVESTQTLSALQISRAPLTNAPVVTTTIAPQVAVNAAPPAVVATASEPDQSVTVPGLGLQLSRSLLIWLLPILLLLIAYLIYSERRERRPREQAAATGARRDSGGPVPGVFALKDDAQPQARSRFQLKPASKRTAEAYQVDEPNLREEAPVHRGAPGRAQRPMPTAPQRDEAPVRGAEIPAPWAGREEMTWATANKTSQAEAAEAEAVTVTPLQEEDEEATYRTQAVARPIIGYLLRATSDPNLPKELPIYGLNPTPGQSRQIHIGRHSKHNTVVINDKSVSREHAVLIQRDGHLFLRDNASTAGTFLNWKRLNPGEELLLRNNDLVSFGQIAYAFRAQSEDEPTIPNG